MCCFLGRACASGRANRIRRREASTEPPLLAGHSFCDHFTERAQILSYIWGETLPERHKLLKLPVPCSFRSLLLDTLSGSDNLVNLATAVLLHFVIRKK